MAAIRVWVSLVDPIHKWLLQPDYEKIAIEHGYRQTPDRRVMELG
jgi:hypothetical protein